MTAERDTFVVQTEEYPVPGSWLDELEAAHAAATQVPPVEFDEERRARLEAEWLVLQAVPDLIARLRAGLALADELEAEAFGAGGVEAKAVSYAAAARLRAVLDPAAHHTEEEGQ